MDLNNLIVFNFDKRKDLVLPPTDFSFDGFVLDTCLRKVFVFDLQLVNFNLTNFLDSLGSNKVEVFQGYNAYQFLLELGCGLQSEIIGETDILGQLKNAWKNFSSINSQLQSNSYLILEKVFQKLFEDIKEIRTQFIQKLGGQSYGSLVRKILNEKMMGETVSESNILLVGAGKIAKSVAPYILDFAKENNLNVYLINRSIDKANEFVENFNHLIQQVEPQNEENIWTNSTVIIVCVPFDKDLDKNRISWIKSGIRKTGQRKIIIHLGGLKAQSGEWQNLEGFVSLDEVFSLQNQLSDERALMIEKAKLFCHQKAKLRAVLGVQLSSYSWEDLFAV